MAQEEGVIVYDNRRGDYPNPEILAKESLTMATGLDERNLYVQHIRQLIRERRKHSAEQGIPINLGTLTLDMQRAYIQSTINGNGGGQGGNLKKMSYGDFVQVIEFAERIIPFIVRAEIIPTPDMSPLLEKQEEEEEEDIVKWEVDESEDDWSEMKQELGE